MSDLDLRTRARGASSALDRWHARWEAHRTGSPWSWDVGDRIEVHEVVAPYFAHPWTGIVLNISRIVGTTLSVVFSVHPDRRDLEIHHLRLRVPDGLNPGGFLKGRLNLGESFDIVRGDVEASIPLPPEEDR